MKNTYSSEQKEYKDHYYKRFIEAHNTNVLAFQALLDDPLKSNVSKVNHDPKWNHYLDCDHVLRDLVRFMETIQQQAFDLWREIREHFVQGFLYSPKTNNQMMYPFPSNELVFPIFPSCIKEKKVDDNRDGSWIVDASDTIFDADIENFKRLLHRALKYSTNYIAHCHLSSDDQISLKFLLKEKKVVITCQRFELVHESSIPFPTKMVALLKEKAKLNLNLNLKLNEVNLISFIFEKSKNAKQKISTKIQPIRTVWQIETRKRIDYEKLLLTNNDMSNLSLVKRAFTQIPSNHRKKHFKRCRYQFSDKFEIFAHMIHYGYILQAMEALQRFPAIAKKRSRYGETLLDFACVNGDANLIRLLIRLGANVNHVNSVFEFPLLIAMKNHQEAAVHVLLEANAEWKLYEGRMTMQDAVFQYKCNTLARTYLTNECIFALKILLELFYCLERVNAKTARIISCLPSFVLKPAEVQRLPESLKTWYLTKAEKHFYRKRSLHKTYLLRQYQTQRYHQIAIIAYILAALIFVCIFANILFHQ